MGIKNFCIGINYLSNWNSSTLDILDKQLYLIKDFYLDILINKKMDITIDLFDGKFISIIVDRKPLFCAAGLKRQITISSNGDIYPCSYVFNDNKWKIGNINTYLDTKTFYKSIKNNLSNDINCNDCSSKYFCSGICAADKINCNNIERITIPCTIRKIIINYILFYYNEKYSLIDDYRIFLSQVNLKLKEYRNA